MIFPASDIQWLRVNLILAEKKPFHEQNRDLNTAFLSSILECHPMIKSKLVSYYLQKWSPLLKSNNPTSNLDYFYFINQNKFINYLLELNYYSPTNSFLLTRLLNLILTNKSILSLLNTSKIISKGQRKSRRRKVSFIKKLLKRSIKTKNWTFEKYVREADCFIDEDEFFEFRLIPENRVYLLPFKKRKRYLSLLTRYNFLRVSKIKLMNKFFRKLVTNTSKSGKQKSSFSRWARALSRRRSKYSVNIYNYLQVLLKKLTQDFFLKDTV